MRMVIFSLALIFIILFRREGIMGMGTTWDDIFGYLGRFKDMNDSNEHLKLEGLTMKFGGLTAVNDLSLEVLKAA